MISVMVLAFLNFNIHICIISVVNAGSLEDLRVKLLLQCTNES